MFRRWKWQNGGALPGADRIDLGARFLFEPEIAVGVQIDDQVSAEATLVHLSHSKLFGPQNPGMDAIGFA